jgi:hypothetical protein
VHGRLVPARPPPSRLASLPGTRAFRGVSRPTPTLRLGSLQIDAFAIFVEGADACYEEGEAPPDDPPFPGRRAGALVTVDAGAERRAWQRLTDAANSADSEGWTEHRDALTALASRVGQRGR